MELCTDWRHRDQNIVDCRQILRISEFECYLDSFYSNVCMSLCYSQESTVGFHLVEDRDFLFFMQRRRSDYLVSSEDRILTFVRELIKHRGNHHQLHYQTTYDFKYQWQTTLSACT